MEIIKQHRINKIAGLPSTIMRIVKLVENKGIASQLCVDSIYFAGEMLYPEQGAKLMRAGRTCRFPLTIMVDAAGRYPGRVSNNRVAGGVVHKLPADLREALSANSTALAAWNDITPLARNEFICWVEDAKQEMTRKRRIRRTQEELEEGQRRPCCWPGCKHRERTGR